jgi:hypothetical protein
MRLTFLCLIYLISTLTFVSVKAQNSLLSYTAQSNILPTNTRELGICYTNKNGGNVYFNGNYTNVGFKMGLSKRFSIGYSLIWASESFVANSISESDRQTRLYDASITDKKVAAFSIYTKMKILDNAVYPVGLAIENELILGANQYTFAPKLIIDKTFGDHYFAFNAGAVLHTQKNVELTDKALYNGATPSIIHSNQPKFEVDMAYLHLLDKTNFGIGIETRMQSEETQEAGLKYLVLFGGPTVHVRNNKWVLNISAMPQLANLRKSWIAPDNLVLDAHQRMEIRAAMSFIF